MWEELDAILLALPRGLDAYTLGSKLRTRLDAAQARHAAEIYLLRERARGRFDEGFLPYLHGKGLEQASGQLAAESRASRFFDFSPAALLWDATCGLGADAVAHLRHGGRVVASDRDPRTASYALANLACHGGAPVVVAAAEEKAVRADWLLLDPDRRPGGKRTLDPRRWSPTLEDSLALAARFSGASLKLAPSFEPGEDLPEIDWQWVSVNGELVELRAWSGELARKERAPGERSLLSLARGRGALEWADVPTACPALAPEDLTDLRVLAEADPSVVRSGLLGNLALRHGLAPIAPRCAYLGSREPILPAGGLLRAWPVLGVSSLDRKRVRKLLARHDVGPLTVKKRGHPDSAETLARRLAGPGARPGLVAVARLEKGHVAILLDTRTPG